MQIAIESSVLSRAGSSLHVSNYSGKGIWVLLGAVGDGILLIRGSVELSADDITRKLELRKCTDSDDEVMGILLVGSLYEDEAPRQHDSLLVESLLPPESIKVRLVAPTLEDIVSPIVWPTPASAPRVSIRGSVYGPRPRKLARSVIPMSSLEIHGLHSIRDILQTLNGRSEDVRISNIVSPSYSQQRNLYKALSLMGTCPGRTPISADLLASLGLAQLSLNITMLQPTENNS